MRRQPKNVLRISDLTFILPDDFEGDFREAMQLLQEHISSNNAPAIIRDGYSTAKTVLTANTNPKLCMKFGVFTADENGIYKLKDSL